MAFSLRAAAFFLLGAVLIIIFPSKLMLWGWIFICAAIYTIDFTAAVSPRTFTVERSVSSPIRADEMTSSCVSVTNPNRRGVRAEVRDAWPPSLSPTPGRHRTTLAAGEKVTLTTQLTPSRRGMRVADYVTIRVWGPLGFVARQVSFSVPVSLEVLPEFRARQLIPSRLARLQDIEGASMVIVRGPGTEFDSLRNYVRGDDPRDIDWRASARSNELVVRTWRPERDRHVVIVLDTGRASAILLGAPDATEHDSLDLGVAPRLDAGIEATLLLEAIADRAGDNVHFIALDRKVRARVSGIRGPELMSSTAHSLVGITPDLLPLDWSLVASEIRKTVRHRSLIVLVTEIPPAGTDMEFSEAVSMLAAQHRVVIASASDPSLPRLLDDRSTVADAYISAAASSLSHEIADGQQEAQRAGAIPVAQDAGLLAARLTDRYLDLKRDGLF